MTATKRMQRASPPKGQELLTKQNTTYQASCLSHGAKLRTKRNQISFKFQMHKQCLVVRRTNLFIAHFLPHVLAFSRRCNYLSNKNSCSQKKTKTFIGFPHFTIKHRLTIMSMCVPKSVLTKGRIFVKLAMNIVRLKATTVLNFLPPIIPTSEVGTTLA
jgi:hypothetical protein